MRHGVLAHVAFRAGTASRMAQPELEVLKFRTKARPQLGQDGPCVAGQPPLLFADVWRFGAQDSVRGLVVDGLVDDVSMDVVDRLPIGARSDFAIGVKVRADSVDDL